MNAGLLGEVAGPPTPWESGRLHRALDVREVGAKPTLPRNGMHLAPGRETSLEPLGLTPGRPPGVPKGTRRVRARRPVQ